VEFLKSYTILSAPLTGHALTGVMILHVLAVLDRSRGPEDMRLPGFRLHALAGDRRGYWAVSVSGNWRVTFCFIAAEAAEVDYVDYH
jgi:toxin HigB-1